MSTEPLQFGAPADRQIAVCEARPWWTPELQRQFRGTGVSIRWSSTPAEILAARTPDLALFHLDHRPGDVLASLPRLRERGDACPVIVIASARLRHLEWGVRELGAASFVADDVRGDDLARMCRKLIDIRSV